MGQHSILLLEFLCRLKERGGGLPYVAWSSHRLSGSIYFSHYDQVCGISHAFFFSSVCCPLQLYFFVSVMPSALCMPPFGMCRPAWACGPHPISAVRVGAGEKTPPLQRPF